MGILPGPVLQCQSCGKTFALDSLVWRCLCGGVLDVKGTKIFPREQLAQRPMNFWRYRESLALPDGAPHISLGEVMTPLVNTRFRGWDVSCKLEYMLPTGSYKDRGIAVCVNHLSGSGVRRVAEDSSGNAGASTAAYAAAAGIHADICVPDGTSMEPQQTCAEGIALPDPPRGTQALRAMRRYHGTMLAVDDNALLSCWRDMAQIGIFMEPTSAVAVAGGWLARESRDLIDPGESVVILITGHGLKTTPRLLNPA